MCSELCQHTHLTDPKRGLPAVLCAGVAYFAGQDIAHVWAAVAPSFSDLRPSFWISARLTRLWIGRGGDEEGYAGLPLADTEMGANRHGCFSQAEPSATLYEPPPQETTALLQDQHHPPDES